VRDGPKPRSGRSIASQPSRTSVASFLVSLMSRRGRRPGRRKYDSGNPPSVLVVTPWWPSSDDDPKFRFIYDSVKSLHSTGTIVSVIVIRPLKVGARRVASFAEHSASRTLLSDATTYPAVRVKLYPSMPGFRLARLNFFVFRAFHRYFISSTLRRTPFDLVHVHTERTAIGAYSAINARGLPSVVAIHSNDATPVMVKTLNRAQRLRRVLASVDAIILVGSALRTRPELPRSQGRILVIGNGVSRNDVESICAHAKPRNFNGPLTLISVSVLFEGKGIQYSLRALAGLKLAGHSNWTYIVIGSGPYEHALRNLVGELELDSQVMFAGQLTNGEVLRALSRCHVFLLPSYFEAFGVAHLEAMAMGCVPIAVRGQGPSDFIDHLKTGLLVEAKSPGSILEILRLMFSDRGLLGSMAANGQRLALAEYTWEDQSRKILNVYAEVLSAMPRSLS
jgi:glycosyltransferase involved in cell wall biosynthesis